MHNPNSYRINRCYNLDVSYVSKKYFIITDTTNRRRIVHCRIAVVKLLQTNRDLFICTYIARYNYIYMYVSF